MALAAGRQMWALPDAWCEEGTLSRAGRVAADGVDAVPVVTLVKASIGIKR